MKKDDFGYFGTGLEGYLHYMQTFDECFPEENKTSMDNFDGDMEHDDDGCDGEDF